MSGSMKNTPNPFEDAETRFRFTPPLCVQRWHHINQLMTEHDCHESFVDVGCGEGEGFTYWMRSQYSTKQTRLVIGLDLDESALEEAERNIPNGPPAVEYLSPCSVRLYKGDATRVDPEFHNVLARESIRCAIAMEVVEHLPSEKVSAFVSNIFQWGLPVLIMSTPNRDANRMIGLVPGKLRHWDHKFEWSSTEFRSWCSTITQRFPHYSFNITYVGKFKACQVACFIKHSDTDSARSAAVDVACYELKKVVEVPFLSAYDRIAITVRGVLTTLPRSLNQEAADTGSHTLAEVIASPQLANVLDMIPYSALPRSHLVDGNIMCSAQLSDSDIEEVVIESCTAFEGFDIYDVNGQTHLSIVHDAEADEELNRLLAQAYAE